jgi:sialate O-acetylesterase
MRLFGANWENWWHATAPADADPWAANAPAGDGWGSAPDTMGDWKVYGDPALAAHTGMVWFRNDFELTAAQAAQGAVLELGSIDEVDSSWVSGQFVGAQFGWGTVRQYRLPAGVLKTGANSVTLNVLNTWGMGGMLGPAESVGLRLDDGQFVPLASGWKYRTVPTDLGHPPRTPWESVGGLTGMYNAMIAPLGGLRLAGAAWYQGESNTGRGSAYAGLLSAMIADWRRLFADARLPFIIVQLTGYGSMTTVPVESGWAEVRDAMRRVAVADPATGMASIMDVGDPFDIHPTNKQVVGKRVAEVAQVLVYGGEGLPDGLSAISARRSGEAVVVDFSQSGAQPVVRGGALPSGFELCAQEAGSCVYADARLDGALVTLSAPGAGTATRVRYAWADTPVVNLYSADGIPAGSFELKIAD